MSNVNLFLLKKKFVKEGKDPFTYIQLVADLGYTNLVVSNDKDIIAQLFDLPVRSLFDIDYDVLVPMATIIDYSITSQKKDK